MVLSTKHEVKKPNCNNSKPNYNNDHLCPLPCHDSVVHHMSRLLSKALISSTSGKPPSSISPSPAPPHSLALPSSSDLASHSDVFFPTICQLLMLVRPTPLPPTQLVCHLTPGHMFFLQTTLCSNVFCPPPLPYSRQCDGPPDPTQLPTPRSSTLNNTHTVTLIRVLHRGTDNTVPVLFSKDEKRQKTPSPSGSPPLTGRRKPPSPS